MARQLVRGSCNDGPDWRDAMGQKSTSILPLLVWLCSIPLVHTETQGGRAGDRVCNQDGTLCVRASLKQSVVQNPFYFEVQVRCPEQIDLKWELRDDAGKVLDQDPREGLAFLVNKLSASERILGVRDFAIAPAETSRGKLLLHARTYSVTGNSKALPELSIPVTLDGRTTQVTYAVPGGKDFAQAVVNTVESDPLGRVAMQAELDWRTTTLLYVQPTMLGGAAAEAAARGGYSGQMPWHVIRYSKVDGTAHLTILGGAWAGVTYYVTGLKYLLEKTVERQPGVRRVVFDRPPDFGQ